MNLNTLENYQVPVFSDRVQSRGFFLPCHSMKLLFQLLAICSVIAILKCFLC